MKVLIWLFEEALKILFIAVFIFVVMSFVGCSYRVDANFINQGIELCKTNEGLKAVKATPMTIEVVCKNNSQFDFNISKGRILER